MLGLYNLKQKYTNQENLILNNRIPSLLYNGNCISNNGTLNNNNSSNKPSIADGFNCLLSNEINSPTTNNNSENNFRNGCHRMSRIEQQAISSTIVNQRVRAIVTDSWNSFDAIFKHAGLNLRQNSTSLTPSSSTSSSSSNTRLTDNFQEKLAITGNIFQKREDWSIIGKIPINKQNTIHIRLEDEGPYGNDEIRCFVLSHFSSLGIRELPCVFCMCKMIIYDRFPLVDGTLFVSPVNYGKERSVPANVSNKNQYIYGICLKCMNTADSDHEIKCINCKNLWKGGNHLQIGTLYKFDIFAAFPCCNMRVCCDKCNYSLVDLNYGGGLPYFSMYSEEVECDNCKLKAYHFIKPFRNIFFESICQANKNLNV